MERLTQLLLPAVQTVNNYLSDYVLLFLLVGTGLFFTLKTGFVQVRCLGEGMRQVFGGLLRRGQKQESGMSSFQALTTAIAAQVGTGNIDPDDITVFWPEYETSISRYTILNDEPSEASGSFKDAAIKWDYLNVEGWSIEAYKAYGLTEDFEHFHNDNIDNGVSILIYKDSFGSPVGCFLSLVAEDVYLVDMRKQDEYAPYFVEKYDPDIVVVAYSQQMICGNEYDLLEGF